MAGEGSSSGYRAVVEDAVDENRQQSQVEREHNVFRRFIENTLGRKAGQDRSKRGWVEGIHLNGGHIVKLNIKQRNSVKRPFEDVAKQVLYRCWAQGGRGVLGWLVDVEVPGLFGGTCTRILTELHQQ